MDSGTPSRKLAENQVVFRRFNEGVQKRLDAVNRVAVEEGEAPITLDEDTPLHFCCECSDENCKERIRLTPKIYNRIHKRRDTFTIVPGHEVQKIETITVAEREYYVVRKHKLPPQSARKLNATDLSNV